MIALNNISLRFGSFTLFSDVGFMINQRDRIGLVGKNGSGKTSLLKIIKGIIPPSEGTVSIPSGVSVGYLTQHLRVTNNNLSVFDEAASAFSEVRSLEEEMEHINLEIAKRTDYDSREYEELLERLSHINDRYHILSSENTDAMVVRTLKGLGFSDEDFTRNTAEFSGGWLMRIELAKLLLQQPDVLLLDEPTNHLDIVAIQWLEEFLKEYSGAVVLISHDRTFLDNVTQRTIEISLGRIYDYKVPYSKFIVLREERLVQQKAAYENQQKMIAETEKFIERFRYKATKANQVQSRIKQLEKIEPVEFDEIDRTAMHFRFPPAPRSGTIILEAVGVSKSYTGVQVIKDIDFIAERGDKVALVGKNGEGKTTFAKIIAGKLQYDGNLKIGHNVKIGYYAQNQEELLNENLTVLETLEAVAVGEVRNKLREILGAFMFSGDDIDKKVKVLSGGEKSRLALACLILEPCNLLILDEPTNHLDLQSKEILRDALVKYDGSLIIVSHDRYFLNGLVHKVFEVSRQSIKEEIGGIDAYMTRYRKQIQLQMSWAAQRLSSRNDNQENAQKQSYIEKKEFDKQLRKLRREHENSEKKIADLEAEIIQTEKLMMQQLNESDNNSLIFEKYQKLKDKLELELQRWQQTGEELQGLSSSNSSY